MMNITAFILCSISATFHFMIYFNEGKKKDLVVGSIMAFFSVLNIVSLIS